MLVISTTTLLLGFYISTASANVPFDNMCPQGQWRRRDCVPIATMTQWRDVCYGSGFDYKDSDCPDYFLCSDIVDARGDRTIKCVPINQVDNTSPRATDGDPQIGTSYKVSADGGGRTTQIGFKGVCLQYS